MAEVDTPPAPAAVETPTPAAPPAGAPSPQPAAPAAEEKVAITPKDAFSRIDQMNDFEKLGETLDASKKVTAKAPEAPEASAPTPAPAATPPASGAPTPTPAAAAPVVEEPGDDDDDKPLPKNFRLHTEDPQRAAFLRILKREPGVDPIAAAQRAGYSLPATASPSAPAAQPQPTMTIDEYLKPKADEIAELKKKKVEARTAYEFDKVDELNEQILDKTLALEKERARLEADADYQIEFESQRTSARAEAIAKYPDTAVEGTPQFEAVMREVAYLERTEPGFFDNPAYPLDILERLEKRSPDLFKGSGSPAPATPAAPPPKVVTPPPPATPQTPARPVGAVVPGNNGSQQPLSREALDKEIDKLSPEQLEELANKVGTPVGPKANRR